MRVNTAHWSHWSDILHVLENAGVVPLRARIRTHSHARTYTRTIASVPSKGLLAIFCFMLTLLATGFTGDVIRLRQEAAEWREQKELASKRKQDEFASMQARKGGVAMGGGKCGNCGVRLPVSSSSVGATFCVNCGVRA